MKTPSLRQSTYLMAHCRNMACVCGVGRLTAVSEQVKLPEFYAVRIGPDAMAISVPGSKVGTKVRCTLEILVTIRMPLLLSNCEGSILMAVKGNLRCSFAGCRRLSDKLHKIVPGFIKICRALIASASPRASRCRRPFGINTMLHHLDIETCMTGVEHRAVRLLRRLQHLYAGLVLPVLPLRYRPPLHLWNQPVAKDAPSQGSPDLVQPPDVQDSTKRRLTVSLDGAAPAALSSAFKRSAFLSCHSPPSSAPAPLPAVSLPQTPRFPQLLSCMPHHSKRAP